MIIQDANSFFVEFDDILCRLVCLCFFILDKLLILSYAGLKIFVIIVDLFLLSFGLLLLLFAVRILLVCKSDALICLMFELTFKEKFEL